MKANRNLYLKTTCFVVLLYFLGGSGAEASAPRRIVSLAPNITEIVFSLGLGDRLVGMTTYCDYPRAAQKKTKIGGFSNPSLEAILALHPDAVILTEDGNPPEIAPRLGKLGIRIHVFRARKIEELPGAIREMGRYLQVEDVARRGESSGSATTTVRGSVRPGGRETEGTLNSLAVPRYHENPHPAYPRLARLRGHEGVVLLAVEVLPDGKVGRLQIKSSSGYNLLDQSALDSIKKWSFEPGRKMGVPIAMWVDVPIRFRLH